jgi:DNA-binding FadR family transcriptional regulator
MAALRATSEDLVEIREAYMGMKRAVEDLPSSIESDLCFHLAVLEATHNAFMRPFMAADPGRAAGQFSSHEQ